MIIDDFEISYINMSVLSLKKFIYMIITVFIFCWFPGISQYVQQSAEIVDFTM